MTDKLTVGVMIQIAVFIGTVGVWYANDQAQSRMIDDHEARIRTIEKDFLIAFGELKGEFQSVKTRLTAIEKAVKP